MSPIPQQDRVLTQSCQVFIAADIAVASGVNRGEGLDLPDFVCPGDVYTLALAARPSRLVILRDGAGQRVAPASQIGEPGEPVDIIARYRLMDPEGASVDLMLLSVGSIGLAALPLSPMGARREYTLLSVEAAPEAVEMADLLCVSFARGTRITLGDGQQRAIEHLAPGDLILTRDHGRQPLRWLGHVTLRAKGAFAPVLITRGHLGNEGDLVVSQHHRVFLYQRDRQPGTTAELLVQARHLVDGDAVLLREGGFVDYFSLVFDRHEIIYAEGIPCESLMVNEATVTRLPADLAAEVKARFPGLSQTQHFGTEAGRQMLDAMGADSILPPRRQGGR